MQFNGHIYKLNIPRPYRSVQRVMSPRSDAVRERRHRILRQIAPNSRRQRLTPGRVNCGVEWYHRRQVRPGEIESGKWNFYGAFCCCYERMTLIYAYATLRAIPHNDRNWCVQSGLRDVMRLTNLAFTRSRKMQRENVNRVRSVRMGYWCRGKDHWRYFTRYVW